MNHQQRQWLSSSTSADAESCPFAVVDHSHIYQRMLEGPHGSQLALAQLEGVGKDAPPFDPFLEEELEEARLLAMEQNNNKQAADDNNDDIVDDTENQPDDDDVMYPPSPMYNNDGSVKRRKSELAIFRAGAPAGGMFAVMELAGSQHKVTTDDLLIVHRLQPLDTFSVGSIHTLDNVLLVSSSALTLVGLPHVPGAQVDVMVEEITKDAKVIVFKNRRRKNSKRKNGFRRDVTMLRILDIRLPEHYQEHEHHPRPLPDLTTEEMATAA